MEPQEVVDGRAADGDEEEEEDEDEWGSVMRRMHYAHPGEALLSSLPSALIVHGGTWFVLNQTYPHKKRLCLDMMPFSQFVLPIHSNKLRHPSSSICCVSYYRVTLLIIQGYYPSD